MGRSSPPRGRAIDNAAIALWVPAVLLAAEALCALGRTAVVVMGAWRGADGGYWIMPLTGQQTIPPPMAYTWGDPDVAFQMGPRAGERGHGGRARRPALRRPAQGDAGGGRHARLHASPSRLPRFEPVYARDDVAILRRRP
jgi:hypothetical protein